MTFCALALVLLMDVSGSVDTTEYALQRDGTAAAFQSEAIGRAVESSGPIAVTAIEWTRTSQTTVRWTILHTADDAARFGLRLAATERSASGMTLMGQAFDAALEALEAAPCEAEREVVDVSGDGRSDDAVAPALERLQARGAVVNALAVPEDRYLAEWFRENAITPGGFVIEAEGWGDFGRAIHRKLVVEISSN